MKPRWVRGQYGASPCPFQLGEKLSWVGQNVPPAVILPAWPPRPAWWIGPILGPMGPPACVVLSLPLRLPPGAYTPSLSQHTSVWVNTWLCSSTRKFETLPHMSLKPDTILSPCVPSVHTVCNIHHTYTQMCVGTCAHMQTLAHTVKAGVHVYEYTQHLRHRTPSGKGLCWAATNQVLSLPLPRDWGAGARCAGAPRANTTASPGTTPAPPLYVYLAGITAGVGGFTGRMLGEAWR